MKTILSIFLAALSISFQPRIARAHLDPDALFDKTQAPLADHPLRNMSVVENGRVIFSEPPSTIIVPGTHLTYTKETLDIDAIPLNGGVLTKTILLSADPYMRGKLKASGPGVYELGKP